MLEIPRAPAIMGPRDEPLALFEGTSARKPANADRYPRLDAFEGRVLLPPGSAVPTHHGVRDGNRSVIIAEAAAMIGGRAYALSAKGVGARPPLYGDSPLEFAFRHDYGAHPSYWDDEGGGLAGTRQVTAEAWFGESPYGAQGEIPARYSLMITEMSEGAQINGFWMCPVVQVVELPLPVMAEANERYWYRRNRGTYLQEHRLVPSNVRVYHEAEWTLGQNPQAVLGAFGVLTAEAADAFIERFLASGFAALTLYVRTMRKTAWGYRGLNYGDVYLDKDAVIAPDGTLHFVDLEGLDWILGGADVPVEERIREQFNYNFYEVMYAVDLLLRERERLAGRPLRQEERRASLAARLEMALARDRFLRCELSGSGLDVVVRPPFAELDAVPIRAIDLR